jgi:hypothetical protein
MLSQKGAECELQQQLGHFPRIRSVGNSRLDLTHYSRVPVAPVDELVGDEVRVGNEERGIFARLHHGIPF